MKAQSEQIALSPRRRRRRITPVVRYIVALLSGDPSQNILYIADAFRREQHFFYPRRQDEPLQVAVVTSKGLMQFALQCPIVMRIHNVFDSTW